MTYIWIMAHEMLIYTLSWFVYLELWCKSTRVKGVREFFAFRPEDQNSIQVFCTWPLSYLSLDLICKEASIGQRFFFSFLNLARFAQMILNLTVWMIVILLCKWKPESHPNINCVCIFLFLCISLDHIWSVCSLARQLFYSLTEKKNVGKMLNVYYEWIFLKVVCGIHLVPKREGRERFLESLTSVSEFYLEKDEALEEIN